MSYEIEPDEDDVHEYMDNDNAAIIKITNQWNLLVDEEGNVGLQFVTGPNEEDKVYYSEIGFTEYSPDFIQSLINAIRTGGESGTIH